MIVWTLAVSDQAKEVLGGRAGTAMPKILSRQELISMVLRIPARTPVSCKLRISFPGALTRQVIPFKHPSQL